MQYIDTIRLDKLNLNMGKKNSPRLTNPEITKDNVDVFPNVLKNKYLYKQLIKVSLILGIFPWQ